MGCVMSVRKKKGSKQERYKKTSSRNSSTIHYETKNDTKAPVFSDKQKQIVMDTWDIVSQDIARVGVITFMRLFEKHPDVQDLFVPFRGLQIDELKNNVGLREHGLRVMGTIEKAIARINKPDKLEEMLYELGEKHTMFDTKLEYLDLITPVLIHSIQPVIGDDWTPEVEEAWLNFLTTITCHMKQGMLQV